MNPEMILFASDFILRDRELLKKNISIQEVLKISEEDIMLWMKDLISKSKQYAIEIDDTKVYVKHVRDIELHEFYCEFYRTKSYSPVIKQKIETLSLFSLVIPEYLRNKGIGGIILEMFQNLAKIENIQIIVVPVMEEHMHNLLEKKKFRHDHLFRYSFYPSTK